MSNFHEINYPNQAGCVGADSRSKFSWHRNCRCHAAELTVQAANRDAFATCIYCDDPASLPAGVSPASDHARYAAELLRAEPSVQLLFTETKVLNGTHGGFDFSALLRGKPGIADERRLEIEVDGPQHFISNMYDTTAEAQQEADARKDAAAWRQGRCVLRLHYKDRSRWAQAVRRAIDRATRPSKLKFLCYTRSYDKRARIARAEVSRAGCNNSQGDSRSIALGRRTWLCRIGCRT